jgi:hypothetical protein
VPARLSTTGLALATLLLVAGGPATAQVPADQPGGGQDASAPGLAPFAGRRVVAIEITGHNVTKDRVITREIRTKVGDPLDLEAVERDVARRQPVDLRGDPGRGRARG